MTKRKYSFDEEKITRFIKEGRGQGHGRQYKPWLNIQDVSSLGRASRIFCQKTQREHHLLSDIETSMFFVLDWSEVVTDIREQFPLDREKTRRIAADMGVRHPFDTQGRTDIVMTTDFVVDVRVGNTTKEVARSVKPASELEKSRTLEKQEIERRYWNEKGIEWALVTEVDLPVQRIKNLRWLHELKSLQHLTEPYEGYWLDRCSRFIATLPQTSDLTLQQFLRVLESSYGFGTGEALTVLRHLAANKQIAIDLDCKFDLQHILVSSLAVAGIHNGSLNPKTVVRKFA